jgi:hypothetical protein
MVRHPTETRHLLLRCVTLSIRCVISYWLITHLLARFFSVSRDDDLLGGMWAVVATLFVYRDSYEESVGAEVGPHQERSGLKNGP